MRIDHGWPENCSGLELSIRVMYIFNCNKGKGPSSVYARTYTRPLHGVNTHHIVDLTITLSIHFTDFNLKLAKKHVRG